MKIALVSYEYPPDTANGGIATYVSQISSVLLKRGHHIEVFAGSEYRSGSEDEDGIIVHRVEEKEPENFSGRIAPVFLKRHQLIQFDVIEGPEYSADAREIIRLVPEIPLVIKLHTPSFLIREISHVAQPSIYESSLYRKLRERAREIRHHVRHFLEKESSSSSYNSMHDIERIHTLEADEIAAPSQAIANRLIADWDLNSEQVSLVPYPYIPSKELLDIPIETNTNTVAFIGRLEVRKGVLDLGKAIPLILKQCPKTKFIFVGQALDSPRYDLNMQEFLELMLRDVKDNIAFTGKVPYSHIPNYLASADVCVFPSIWENFPNVCLEAMAAGRGIVGSCVGGFPEMLASGTAGKIVQPNAPRELASAVMDLLSNKALRMELGKSARLRVLSEYNSERIALLQEESYQRAVHRRKLLGPRSL